MPGIINALAYNNLSAGETDSVTLHDGSMNQQLISKWRDLTSTSGNIQRIPKLIWTDLAANLFVGTRSVGTSFPNAKMQVEMFERKITYNYVYAIPALICWTIWIASAVISIILLFSKNGRSRLSLSCIKQLVNQLSAGRSLTATDNPIPEGRAVGMGTKKWVSEIGKTNVDLFKMKEEQEELRLSSESRTT